MTLTARRVAGLASLALVVAAVSPAQAGPDWSNLPDSRQTIVDEPVFGGQAWVLEAGLGHRRSVVLVHGLGDDASLSWHKVVPALTRTHRVVVFDLPGFGRSTHANELYDPEHYAAFVDFVTSRFVDGPFALIGHSMGGAIALRYAADYPENVERLVLVDVAGILHRVAYSKAVAQSGIRHFPGRYPGQKRISRWIGDFLSSSVGMSAVTRIAEESILSTPALRQRFFQGDPNTIAGYALLLHDFSEALPRVRAPTLVIWGAKDSIAPLRTGHALAGNIAGARLAVIPGARHTPMKGEPKHFLEILTDYLAIPSDAITTGVHGQPYALDVVAKWESDRIGECKKRRRRLLFEGDYDRIVIDRCKDVSLDGVRVREVQIADSRVAISNSVVRGPGAALRITGSRVTLTASRVEGSTAVVAEDSRLDVAGALLSGERAAIEVPDTGDTENVKVLFSISRVESAETVGTVHGPRTVRPDRPL